MLEVKKISKAEEMYLDWFNNFLSTEVWRDHYGLSIAEGENILDVGRSENHKRK